MSLYESLAPLYDGFFPIDRRAPAFLDSLSRQASVAAAPRVLDAGCATGGHALALAELGWTSLGIDSEAAMVELAVAAAWRKGLADRASFVVGDIAAMDGLVGDASFDLALCLGNTLPHLGSSGAGGQSSGAGGQSYGAGGQSSGAGGQSSGAGGQSSGAGGQSYGAGGQSSRAGGQSFGAAAFLGRTLALLAPGGSVVLQMMNYARPGLGPGYSFPELGAKGAVMRRSYGPVPEADGSLRFLVELTHDGRTQVSETRLVPLVPGQVESLLLRAGFQAPAFYSGWDGGPFDERRDSFFIAVAAR